LGRHVEPDTDDYKVGVGIDQHELAVVVDGVSAPARLPGDEPDAARSAASPGVEGSESEVVMDLVCRRGKDFSWKKKSRPYRKARAGW
jgi:hypothetical protein